MADGLRHLAGFRSMQKRVSSVALEQPDTGVICDSDMKVPVKHVACHVHIAVNMDRKMRDVLPISLAFT